MIAPKDKSLELAGAVIHICPVCGVVNPSGPSETCQHLQLARFEGMGSDMASLLGEVADARKAFTKLADELTSRVKTAIREGQAEIVPSRKVRTSEIESLRPRPKAPPELTLEHPESKAPKKVTKRRASRARRHQNPPPVDSRQLDLIAREPPKGHA